MAKAPDVRRARWRVPGPLPRDNAAPTTPAEFAPVIDKDMATRAELVKATGTKPGN